MLTGVWVTCRNWVKPALPDRRGARLGAERDPAGLGEGGRRALERGRRVAERGHRARRPGRKPADGARRRLPLHRPALTLQGISRHLYASLRGGGTVADRGRGRYRRPRPQAPPGDGSAAGGDAELAEHLRLVEVEVEAGDLAFLELVDAAEVDLRPLSGWRDLAAGRAQDAGVRAGRAALVHAAAGVG